MWKWPSNVNKVPQFQIDSIQFNGATLTPAPGVLDYVGQTSVSTDPYPVKVTASIEPSTGTVTFAKASTFDYTSKSEPWLHAQVMVEEAAPAAAPAPAAPAGK